MNESRARIVDGKYRIHAVLGRGSMGTVYSATHALTRARVAIKLLPPATARSPQGAERFRREVAIAAKVAHPGIVQVLDAGIDPADDTHYVVMEHLDGEDLRDRAQHAGFTIRLGINIVRSMLNALAAAHHHGVVHRDIKPENIFIHRRSDSPHEVVKLLDFGIARDTFHGNTVTGADVALGTPHFMSPEQATSARSVTAAADVWSVGIILYWLLVGRLPFQEDTPFNTLRAVCTEPAAPIDIGGGEVTRRIAEVTMRCLRKEPADRPANAGELAAELDTILGPLGETQNDSPTIDVPHRQEISVLSLPFATNVKMRSDRRWFVPLFVIIFLAAAVVAFVWVGWPDEPSMVATPIRKVAPAAVTDELVEPAAVADEEMQTERAAEVASDAGSRREKTRRRRRAAAAPRATPEPQPEPEPETEGETETEGERETEIVGETETETEAETESVVAAETDAGTIKIAAPVPDAGPPPPARVLPPPDASAPEPPDNPFITF